MSEIYIAWYDEYDYPCPKESRVYFVDSTRDRFLVVDDNKNFRWVSTDDGYYINCRPFSYTDIGNLENIFKTRKEAEAAFEKIDERKNKQ